MSKAVDLIKKTRVRMMMGHKLKQKEIYAYEDAIRSHLDDNKIEIMMLFFAETLHDHLGFGENRTRNTLRFCDNLMKDWSDESFDIDALRIRVFEKTHFVFATTPEDMDYIAELLKLNGFDVTVDEGKGEM